MRKYEHAFVLYTKRIYYELVHFEHFLRFQFLVGIYKNIYTSKKNFKQASQVFSDIIPTKRLGAEK